MRSVPVDYLHGLQPDPDEGAEDFTNHYDLPSLQARLERYVGRRWSTTTAPPAAAAISRQAGASRRATTHYAQTRLRVGALARKRVMRCKG